MNASGKFHEEFVIPTHLLSRQLSHTLPHNHDTFHSSSSSYTSLLWKEMTIKHNLSKHTLSSLIVATVDSWHSQRHRVRVCFRCCRFFERGIIVCTLPIFLLAAPITSLQWFPEKLVLRDWLPDLERWYHFRFYPAFGNSHNWTN